VNYPRFGICLKMGSTSIKWSGRLTNVDVLLVQTVASVLEYDVLATKYNQVLNFRRIWDGVQ
jgi:hypothetical protein